MWAFMLEEADEGFELQEGKMGEKKSVEDVFISLQCNRQVDEWKFPVRKV